MSLEKRVPRDMPIPFRVVNGKVRFNGDCDACLSHCGAACCKGHAVIPLSDEEVQSGRYVTEQKVNMNGDVKWSLKTKYKEGHCVYLDENDRCSIYEDRPLVCQKYDCSDHDWDLVKERRLTPDATGGIGAIYERMKRFETTGQ